ncbi:MAG: GHMP family kinase ATP-binding protein [Promethearchaeota archaeon]
MKNVEEWISIFKDINNSYIILKEHYSNNYRNLEAKRKEILTLLNLHKNKFGNEEIIIVRSPGRINLMGRHIDHQGGCVNLIAIDREIFLTASLRRDLKIIAYNLNDSIFPDIKTDFNRIKDDFQEDWIQTINNSNLINKIKGFNGNWENYLKGSFLRLLKYFKEKRIYGVNFCVSGNIPIAAGLSSSSALVVGIIEAILYLNHLECNDEEFIKLCSEAEWFVGTRGGSADHVAIKYSKKNKVAHVKFFDFKILDWANFPKGLSLLICNTNIIADKSGKKKDFFNQRILSYDVGFNIIKQKFPQYKNKLKYLRDINKNNLKISNTELFKILAEAPEYIRFGEIRSVLGEIWEKIKDKFEFESNPKVLPIRKVITFGISEFQRSILFFKLFKLQNFRLAGSLMYISHDGDRIVSYNNTFTKSKYYNEISDEKICSFIENRKKIVYISGGYECSIPEIDFIVDIVKNLDGTYGAQLSGAGLGGSVMILVEKSYISNIKETIKENYEKKFNKECEVFETFPVNGCSIIKQQKTLNYIFECVQCASCCKAGYEIHINKSDVIKWEKAGKTEFLAHIQIDPKCISLEGLGGFHIEKKNALEKLKKTKKNIPYEKKIKELINFIERNHDYHGESSIPLPIYTILPGKERRPVLTPKNFQVIFEGKKRGLIYYIKLKLNGTCPFLKGNKCSIHEIKPKECLDYPFDKQGRLRIDKYVLKVCRGIKKKEFNHFAY